MGGGATTPGRPEGSKLQYKVSTVFLLQWRVNRPTIANCKAATQYFDVGAHSGAGMMHSEGLGGLSGLVAIEFNPQHTQVINEKIIK